MKTKFCNGFKIVLCSRVRDRKNDVSMGKLLKPLHEHLCFLCNNTFLSTKKKKLVFCLECQKSDLHQIAVKIRINLRRAKLLDLPATLTTKEWLETIAHFHGKCAYCQHHPYTCIEHYIPLDLGGGTTKNNCLPSCRGCNHHKKSFSPEMVLSQEDIDRIQSYLLKIESEMNEAQE